VQSSLRSPGRPRTSVVRSFLFAECDRRYRSRRSKYTVRSDTRPINKNILIAECEGHIRSWLPAAGRCPSLTPPNPVLVGKFRGSRTAAGGSSLLRCNNRDGQRVFFAQRRRMPRRLCPTSRHSVRSAVTAHCALAAGRCPPRRSEAKCRGESRGGFDPRRLAPRSYCELEISVPAAM
jgi:hypothetical protein